MDDEKHILLDRINNAIKRQRKELLSMYPYIHLIDDGIIVRSFRDWRDCAENENIKYQKINNYDDPDEVIINFFLPKGTVIEQIKREYIRTVTCTSGCFEIKINDKIQFLTGTNKIVLDFDEFEGIAHEDTYLITSNKI